MKLLNYIKNIYNNMIGGGQNPAYMLGMLLYISAMCVLGYILVKLSILTYMYPNIRQIDMAGQMASSFFGYNLGLHSYNTHWFMGLVNNLFYPPMQDFITYIFHSLGSGDYIYNFKIYLICLYVFYFITFGLLSTRISNPYIKTLYIVSVVGYLFISKNNLTFFQGGAIMDMYFTGLNSQILGLIFLNMIIYELYGKARWFWVYIYLSGAILSHIVVAPIAFVLVLAYTIASTDRRFIYSLVFAVATTAFFRAPFLLTKKYITSAQIIFDIPYIMFVLHMTVVGLGIYLSDRKIIALGLAGYFFILPSDLQNIFAKWSIDIGLPVFHYYRFASPSLLVGIWAMMYAMDIYMSQSRVCDNKVISQVRHSDLCGSENSLSKKSSVQNFCHKYIYTIQKYYQQYIYPYISTHQISIYSIFGILWIISMLKIFSFIGFHQIQNIVKPYHMFATGDISVIQQVNDGKRMITIDNKRAVDFNLDSILQVYNTGLHTVKGLYRETSHNNNILTSYLSMLMNKQDMIVNYFHQEIPGCKEYIHLRERFIDRYAIGWILINDLSQTRVLNDQQKDCLNAMLVSGSVHLSFAPIGTMKLNNLDYHLAKVINNKKVVNNEYVQAITRPAPVLTKKDGDMFSFRRAISDDFSDLHDTDVLYMSDIIDFNTGDIARDIMTQMHLSGHISDVTIDQNPKYPYPNQLISYIYTGDQLNGKNGLTKIKMNYYPGVRAVDSNGNQLIIYPLLDGMLVKGSGHIVVYYQLDTYIYMLYILSVLCIFGSIYLYFIRSSEISNGLKIDI